MGFVSRVLLAVFVAYLAVVGKNLWDVWNPPTCSTPATNGCLKPHFSPTDPLDVVIFASTRPYLTRGWASLREDLRFFDAYAFTTRRGLPEKVVRVRLPKGVRKNGTLWAHGFLSKHGVSPDPSNPSHRAEDVVPFSAPLTRYLVDANANKTLLIGAPSDGSPRVAAPGPSLLTAKAKPITHWRPRLSLRIVEEERSFHFYSLPAR